MFSVDDFDYALPPELIAQHPASERSQSRLLRLVAGRISDHRFSDLPDMLDAGDVIVFNDTRVIKARLFGSKESGGRVEVLVERIVSEHEVLAHVRASKSPKAGSRMRLADAFDATMLARDDDLFHLRFEADASALALLDRHGAVPLPPYITHVPDSEDESRYQTVYARNPGSVAAPTAGLHFDDTLLARLRAKGVETAHLTLHVGAGTFQPMRAKTIAEHRMHTEWYEIPQSVVDAIDRAHAAGHKVTAVGTTTLRALEGAALKGTLRAGAGETDLFITPGFTFRVVDRLVTNFHLPKSTLLMLVSAFSGYDEVRRAYRHAVDERYRFFSYGDAMLADRINA